MMNKKGRRKSPFLNVINNIINNGLENFGKFYSKYRAFVFDNDDPERLGRIKVICPQVGGSNYLDTWAYPTGVPSDVHFGMQMIPKIGSVVWVEFEGGNPEIPIWSHGHFGRKEMPTDDDDLYDLDCYWLITPTGHRIKINDTKNYINIKSSKGDEVELNDIGVSLVSKAISLGTKDGSKYHAVQGENLKDLLTDINDILKQLHGALTKDLVLSQGQPFLKYVNLAITVPLILPEVQTLTEKLDLILSTVNTLE